jgi:hypothetical protein
LARQCDDKDERKRLWLMIARNAAGNGSASRDGKDVVSRVVMVLKECGPEILSIEDVSLRLMSCSLSESATPLTLIRSFLVHSHRSCHFCKYHGQYSRGNHSIEKLFPFFISRTRTFSFLARPDFAQIDQFKDEICNALASYSSKIEHYLKEMNECDQTCDALRDELSRLKNTGTHVRADARCALTNQPIFETGEPFYAFPSGYVALETALKREVTPHLNERQLGRLNFIENELEKIRKSQSSEILFPSDIARYDYELEELATELSGLIAAECPLTGSVMVESIDRGFSSDEED